LESISHIERTNAVEHLLHAKSEACITDEGAESAEYTITGKMSLTDYKEILIIFRGGQPWFHDPFEERQMKASSSALTMTVLVEVSNLFS